MWGCSIAVTALLLLAGCADFMPASCPAGLTSVMRAELFFGRDIAGKPGVSEEDWQRFLDEEVTPRFSEGLTVEDAYGQWKGADGAIVREASKHLIVVEASHDTDKLAAIREAYKRRFHQESVLLLETKSCGSF